MIGRLRHQITFQSQSRTPDGAGGFTVNWANGATVWAEIQPKGGIKRFFAERLEPVVTHVLTIRFTAGITTSMRFLYGSRVFQIHSVINPDERSRWLYIHAVEGSGS